LALPIVLCSSLSVASEAEALNLLKAVENERMKYECFRICYTEHREEENKTVEQIVDFDHGKIRKEHLKTDRFGGMKSIFLGDFLYSMTSYDAKSVDLVTPKSVHAYGADIYDPRMLGLTVVMNQATSVTDCLLYTRRNNFSTQMTELNGKKVHLVVCDDGDDHWEFFIEEPSFRLLRKTLESPYIDMQIDSEYLNPKFYPFPSQVKAIRKEGKEHKTIRFNRTITVTNFEVKKSFPPEMFTLASLNLPLNATVTDYRINRTIGYWDGEKLVDDPVRISVQERQEIEEMLQQRQQHNQIVRYIMGTIGVLLIVFAVVLMIRKRVR
jgi:predicted nucleic acid-binding Zn ribbon protein